MANGKTISASQFLRLFLFDDITQYSPISKLSGGEKRRLHLMFVLYQNPNFLILDEPTNDLDLPTLTVLEGFLQQFQGSVIIVSHDRYFMDKIVGHILAFEGEGKIKNFTGNFSEYRNAIKENTSAKAVSIDTTKELENKPKPNVEKKKLSYKEQRELEKIEQEIPSLEEKRNTIVELLNNETDYTKITTYSADLEKISEQLEMHELRWLELQELIG
jgi:ATP-binding cassette subfamily F protein uup